MTQAKEIFKTLIQSANPDIAEHSQRFFKTGEGDYGAGDKFLGIRVPVIRKLVKQSKQASMADAVELISNEYHEVRLFAVLLMVHFFERSKNDEAQQEEIVSAYLANTAFINNWDLVDSSAHKILGKYLFNKDRTLLFKLAKSASLWERRISMMSTYYFIKQGQFEDTFKIAEILLDDNHDLIHKIVGWMLREVGNKNKLAEENFLKSHYVNMPRTMLRYAIEKFPKEERELYLKGKI